MTQSERREALSLYISQGATLDALSEKYGRHRETIRRLVSRNNAQRGEHYTVTRRRLMLTNNKQ